MNKKRNVIILLFLAFSLLIVSCSPLTPVVYPTPSSTNYVQPILTLEPTTTPTPRTGLYGIMVNSEQLKKNEAEIGIAHSFLDQARKTYFQPGWIHMIKRTENYDFLWVPEAVAAPKEWREEIWALADDQGDIAQAIIFRNVIKKKTQVITFQNGIWKNQTLGTSGNSAVETYSISFDEGFFYSADAMKEFVEMDHSFGVIDSEKVVVFTMTGPMSSFSSSPDTIEKYYVSCETGWVIKVEDYRPYSDGQFHLFTLITTELFEKVEQPPAEAMKYFE